MPKRRTESHRSLTALRTYAATEWFASLTLGTGLPPVLSFQATAAALDLRRAGPLNQRHNTAETTTLARVSMLMVLKTQQPPIPALPRTGAFLTSGLRARALNLVQHMRDSHGLFQST